MNTYSVLLHEQRRKLADIKLEYVASLAAIDRFEQCMVRGDRNGMAMAFNGANSHAEMAIEWLRAVKESVDALPPYHLVNAVEASHE